MKMSFHCKQQFRTGLGVFVNQLPQIIAIVVFVGALNYLLTALVQRLSRWGKIEPKVLSMLLSAGKFVAWVLGVAAVLNTLGLTQLSLALGGSIALIGAALATGLNTIPQDLLAGVFLISDDELTIGKRIKAGNIEGRLVELNIRKTRVRDDNGNLHTIPNRTVDSGIYTIYQEDDSQ